MDTLHKVESILRASYSASITLQLFSSLKRTGIDEAHAVLDALLLGDPSRVSPD
jgi:GTP-binding protein EngB required for normal cell division